MENSRGNLLAWLKTRLLGRLSTGERGERIAARWLRRQGFHIMHRNLAVGDDEADIVAIDPDGKTVVIVEVKTSINEAGGVPEQRITDTKQRRLARLASRLGRSKSFADKALRFDAVGVVLPPKGKPIVRHHPGVFNSPW